MTELGHCNEAVRIEIRKAEKQFKKAKADLKSAKRDLNWNLAPYTKTPVYTVTLERLECVQGTKEWILKSFTREEIDVPFFLPYFAIAVVVSGLSVIPWWLIRTRKLSVNAVDDLSKKKIIVNGCVILMCVALICLFEVLAQRFSFDSFSLFWGYTFTKSAFAYRSHDGKPSMFPIQIVVLDTDKKWANISSESKLPEYKEVDKIKCHLPINETHNVLLILIYWFLAITTAYLLVQWIYRVAITFNLLEWDLDCWGPRRFYVGCPLKSEVEDSEEEEE
ncbi:hypothetical protein L596_006011 [Steinernema carpocapsae]|uniref:Uncharacterized protein n=1 Tax=Steinernema carpocapsae TaxID=34508 RepID=A0A4U8V7K7_STECR|nr:hypothetical protein L596_006011 [Steinernema carpocapsae]